MNYISKDVNDKYIVWLAGYNRYIIFQPPAFEVFKRLSKNGEPQQIASYISKKYNLDTKESIDFISDIRNNLSKLEEIYSKTNFQHAETDFSRLIKGKVFKEISYSIFNKSFRFYYSSPWMMDFIHPGIAHLQTENPTNNETRFYIIDNQDELLLGIDGKQTIRWPVNETAYFKGSVSLQLLNRLYNKTDNDWMGTFHASAVANNGNAILFPASSGSGKSTLSALLAASGFQLISDDLVAISLDKQEMYPFPSAITVKQGAFDALLPFYPKLKNKQTKLNTSTGKEVAYLVPPHSQVDTPSKAKALVFPVFSSDTEFEWEAVDNLSLLNDFLTESWIADNQKAVKTFLDWFFEIPCYRMRYNNNNKAVEKIGQLF